MEEPVNINGTRIYVHTFVDRGQVKKLVGQLAGHFGHETPVIEEGQPL